MTIAEWSSDKAAAAIGSVAGEPCNGNEATDEEDVEDNGDEAEEATSSEAEDEEDR